MRGRYRFTYTPGTPDDSGHITSYTITAQPVKYSPKTERSFFNDQSGVIRATRENRPATADDNPL